METMATSDIGEGNRPSATSDNNDSNFELQEEKLKKEKTTAKSNFTRSKNKLISLIDLSRRSVLDECDKLNIMSEKAMDVITRLSDLYEKAGDIQKYKTVNLELEKLDFEFTTTHDAAREYLDSKPSGRSSIAPETLNIDLLERMNITDNNDWENVQQQTAAFQRSAEMQNLGQCRPISTAHANQNEFNDNYYPATGAKYIPQNKANYEQQRFNNDSLTNMGPKVNQEDITRRLSFKGNTCSFNNYDVGQRATQNVSIGQDLWKQLKRVQIPVFSGDKRCYQGWKAAFIACIDNAPVTPGYKLLQLRQYLSGEALHVIDNLGHSATAYEAAKDRLERKYGGKRRQIAIYLDELEHFRQVRLGNASDLEQFADLLDVAIINLKEAGQHHELGDGSLYIKLQRKLPETLLARYHRWIFENNKTESVINLRIWTIQEAEFQTIASETLHRLSAQSSYMEFGRQNSRSQQQRTFYGNLKDNKQMTNMATQCILCERHHLIFMCQEFLQMNASTRWEVAKQNRLCYRCQIGGHRGDSCQNSRRCGIDGCKDTHHRLLHKQGTQVANGLGDGNVDMPQTKPHPPPVNQESEDMEGNRWKYSPSTLEPQTTMVAQGCDTPYFVGLRTVPVILKNGNRELKVNALLDDASTKTYVNAEVAAEIGLHGKTEPVKVNILNGQVETFETTCVSLELRSVDGKVATRVGAYTANRVTGNMNVVDWNKYSGRWQHLQSIIFPRVDSRRPIVDVLIGLDCADLHYALKEIRGRPGEPVARLTPLGWTCTGCPVPGPHESRFLQTNFARTYFAKDQSELVKINESIQRFWDIDNTPTLYNDTFKSGEVKVAVDMAKRSLKYENGMYEVGVPWKENDVDLPNYYEMALRRLQNTERRLKKTPMIEKAYEQCITQYVEKGYVRKVHEEGQAESKWYLPHFPVIRLDKDITKTRIVFDASARFAGVSLNDVIHQGPKLQRELFDVLLRFRRFPIAVVCDIAEMYLRIGIPTQDRLYHRFLWRGMNVDKPPDVYEFTRVVFGVNSSPFQAQFVSQQHAIQYKDEFPMAAETVLKSTYMDDSMDSAIDEEQGIELYNQLSQMWTKAGMHARKWLSNSGRVLKQIPLQYRKSEVDLDTLQLPSAKTLGVWWIADSDVFTFKENAPNSDMQYTKRNFLSKIATLFDPIGLLAPFTIRAKMLLQDMWTAGLEWDEEMDEQLIQTARSWFTELGDLTQIQVPRCLSNPQKMFNMVELHTFVDASQSAYGAVVYARYTYQDGSLSTGIVAAKTRVAPTVYVSIPRLELMGAIAGLRLTIVISKTLETRITDSTFWSDSLNVLWWIRGRSREFKPFVANRVGEIQSSTSPAQWRYVPTKENPADLLRRGMKAKDLARSEKWWLGPMYLTQSKEVWPDNKMPSNIDGCSELKGTSKKQSVNNAGKHPGTTKNTDRLTFISVFQGESAINPKRYSSWTKLKRIQAWTNRFTDNCQLPSRSRRSGELTSDEIIKAEVQLIQQTQRTAFSEEWTALSRRKTLPLNSKLLCLQPKIDEDGLLRSDGRLKYAEFLSYDVRFPVILPRKSWVTTLIIKHFHELGHHASGTNQTLAALSTRYWIVAGREAIREWEKECAECRRRKAKACKQIMAPLPVTRLQTSMRAFTRASVDFGGPYITIQGRGKRREKRYLCLFTCLATRAVHLEVAHGLDTDSFLNAFSRMASRRGLPEEMLSDNGTNFKSSDKELKMLVSQLDKDRINESVATKGVKWTFNPPLAPHFGGVHETMIKAAKRAISAILGNADINDEELLTAVIWGGIVNKFETTNVSVSRFSRRLAVDSKSFPAWTNGWSVRCRNGRFNPV